MTTSASRSATRLQAAGQAVRSAPAAVAWDRDRRPRWWLEGVFVLWLAWIYDIITDLPAERKRAAVAHGLAVLHLEQRVHLDPELALDHWLYHHRFVGLLAGDYYDNVHFVVTFAVLGWLWWRHPRQYRPLRTALVLVNVIGFLVFWRYPVAPPRLLPGQHFYDIIVLVQAIGSAHSGTLSKAANQFAAMPSLHLAWASWSALAVWTVIRGRRWAPLVLLYPAVTLVVVMATGNHFLADCVLGVATTAVSALVAFGINRVTTRAWPGTGRPPGRAHPAPVPAPDQS